LTLCEDQFNENTLPVCPEVVELQVCLAACVNNKDWPNQVVRLKYELLVKKMNSYPDCIPASKGIDIYLSVLLCASKDYVYSCVPRPHLSLSLWGSDR